MRAFRHMPWLSLPFTHALRRDQLRTLFEVSETADSVVLLHTDGTTISRDGKQHMLLAYRCQSAIDEKKSENETKKKARRAARLERAASPQPPLCVRVTC